ncbi:hypothetical protein ATE48_09145 [Candidatus Viadribacter manganicus]|uniref:Uncharacterized protein n=1 Tax=Candidatus Viadribacter manganicus TaxID=1759059 RepID=A0A1B1AHN6_9PROT|nr:hypothetical protein ATE48_09145 [Candidatus Viadribacter manganicus]
MRDEGSSDSPSSAEWDLAARAGTTTDRHGVIHLLTLEDIPIVTTRRMQLANALCSFVSFRFPLEAFAFSPQLSRRAFP